ncbi:LytR/AlgR family response regulator transcription factor [Hymenobacter terrenus]|uniref:LytR/AlgR family response regulator transcription factor n=1 Tax=Hymenobacter terrenus TaxID=1629124 RepID=UPI000619786F|nr:LytTR family DNA-binding domain-containing protein [Hymenobacter terrenus]
MSGPYSCLIVDDEPLARNLLTEYVAKAPFLRLHAACASPLAALDILRQHPIDLLFLDVHMPELTGLGLLRALPRQPLVIFTTAYSEYALESYELDVVDYLLKPIALDRFLRAVHKVSQRLATPPPAPATPPAFLFVKDGTKLVNINLNDLLFVEGLRDYVALHTRQQKIVSLQRLKTLETQLPTQQFIRIHQSYIVALAGIEAVYKDKVQVVGGRLLPISDTYRKPFRDFIERNHLPLE